MHAKRSQNSISGQRILQAMATSETFKSYGVIRDIDNHDVMFGFTKGPRVHWESVKDVKKFAGVEVRVNDVVWFEKTGSNLEVIKVQKTREGNVSSDMKTIMAKEGDVMASYHIAELLTALRLPLHRVRFVKVENNVAFVSKLERPMEGPRWGLAKRPDNIGTHGFGVLRGEVKAGLTVHPLPFSTKTTENFYQVIPGLEGNVAADGVGRWAEFFVRGGKGSPSASIMKIF